MRVKVSSYIYIYIYIYLVTLFVPFYFVGYAQHIRDELSEIKILQNLQMARLCDIAGKNRSHLPTEKLRLISFANI